MNEATEHMQVYCKRTHPKSKNKQPKPPSIINYPKSVISTLLNNSLFHQVNNMSFKLKNT